MLTAAEVNAMSEDAFRQMFGGVIEASPWAASIVWERRPFADREQLCTAFEGAIRRLPRDRQMDIIRAHPDLVGCAAQAGTLSSDSTAEQASAGLDRLSSQDISEFQRLNTAYWERFGFPFIICVRENRKESIIAGLTARVQNSPDVEIATAIDEICKIVRLRLMDRVSV
jgi:OHCU decarboxylase